MLPTPDNILEHVQKTKTNALTAIPTLLQIWAQNQASIDILSSMIQVVCVVYLFIVAQNLVLITNYNIEI